MTSTIAPTPVDYRTLPHFSKMTEEELQAYWQENDVADFLKLYPDYFPEWKNDEQLFCLYRDGKLETIETFYEEQAYIEHLNNWCHPDDHGKYYTIKELGAITTPVTGCFIQIDWEYAEEYGLERAEYMTLNSVEELEAWYKSENNPDYNGDKCFLYWEDANGHREYVLRDLWPDLERLFGKDKCNTWINFAAEYLAGVYAAKVVDEDNEDIETNLTGEDIVIDALQSLLLAKELKSAGLVSEILKSVIDYSDGEELDFKRRQCRNTHDGMEMYQLDNELPMKASDWYNYLAERHTQIPADNSLHMFATVLMTNQVTPLLQALAFKRKELGLSDEQMRQISIAGLALHEELFKEDHDLRLDDKGRATARVANSYIQFISYAFIDKIQSQLTTEQ